MLQQGNNVYTKFAGNYRFHCNKNLANNLKKVFLVFDVVFQLLNIKF